MNTFKQNFITQSSRAVFHAPAFQATIETMDRHLKGNQDLDSVGQRLEKFILDSGMTYSQFAQKVAMAEGLSSKVSPQTVNHWRKTGKIARDKLVTICNVLGITPNDLLGVKGDIYSSKDSSTIDKNVQHYSSVLPARPVIASVVAGRFREAVPAMTADNTPWFERPDLSRGSDQSVWLIVEGDSMDDGTSNSFRSGDLILVDPDAAWASGDYVIIANGGNEWTFKRIRKDGPTWYMEALNPSYHPRVREIPVEWRVVAKVLEVKPRGRKVG